MDCSRNISAFENVSFSCEDAFRYNNLISYVFPIILVNNCFGIVGNLLSIAAFVRLFTAKQQPYVHQISVIVTDLLSLLFLSVAVFGEWKLRIFEHLAPPVVQRSVVLYLFFLAYVIQCMLGTATLLLLIFISFDRLQAFLQPVTYRTVDQKRRNRWFLVFSYIPGILTSIHDCFRYRLISSDDQYYLVFNENFLQSNSVGVGFTLGLMCLRAVCLLALLVLKLLIIVLHKRQSAARMERINRGSFSHSSLRIRRESDFSLTKLLLGQIFLISVEIVPWIIFMIVLYLQKNYRTPLEWYLGLLATLGASIAVSWNFIVYILLSQQFRSQIYSILIAALGSSRCQRRQADMGGDLRMSHRLIQSPP